jgi:hypothetical protein
MWQASLRSNILAQTLHKEQAHPKRLSRGTGRLVEMISSSGLERGAGGGPCGSCGNGFWRREGRQLPFQIPSVGGEKSGVLMPQISVLVSAYLAQDQIDVLQ